MLCVPTAFTTLKGFFKLGKLVLYLTCCWWTDHLTRRFLDVPVASTAADIAASTLNMSGHLTTQQIELAFNAQVRWSIGDFFTCTA